MHKLSLSQLILLSKFKMDGCHEGLSYVTWEEDLPDGSNDLDKSKFPTTSYGSHMYALECT